MIPETKKTPQKDIRQHFLNNHAALLSITRAFMSALWLQASQLHAKCANVWGKPCNLWVISSANSLHLWCRTPRWLPELLCNTSEPNCGNVPDQLCPRSQTSLSCHPNILSESGKPLGVGRGQAKQTNKKTGGVRFLWLFSQCIYRSTSRPHTHKILCLNIYLMVLDFTHSIKWYFRYLS